MKLGNKIAVLFFLFIMCFSITKNLLLISIYEYNTALFVSLFCENKNRPELKCNGQCILAKMQKEQDKKDATNALKNLQSNLDYFVPSSSSLSFHNFNMGIFCLLTLPQAHYQDNYKFLFSRSLVKPPEA